MFVSASVPSASSSSTFAPSSDARNSDDAVVAALLAPRPSAPTENSVTVLEALKDTARPTKPVRVRGANRSACETCRRRKIRCTGEKPACSRCAKMNKPCVYHPEHDASPDSRRSSVRPRASESAMSEKGTIVSLPLRRSSHSGHTPRYGSRSASPTTNGRIRLYANSPSPVPVPRPQSIVHSSAPHRRRGSDAAYKYPYPSYPPQPAPPNRRAPSYTASPSPARSPAPSTSPRDPNRSPRQHQQHHATPRSPARPPSQAYNIPSVESRDIPSPRYEAISTTYPKPHDRPLPSNDQVLLHLSSDLDLGGVSLSGLPTSSAPPRNATHHANRPVTIDRSILPSAPEVTALFQHFQGYTSAAFPIFYMPDLRAWTEDVCFKGVPVEAEVACAVLLVLAVSATSLPQGSALEHLKKGAAALWEYGQKFLPPVFLPPIDERRGLLRVQVMLIRLQYVLHNPSSGNVWGLSGAAVRAAVDLGLHHEGRSSFAGRSPIETDTRRRVFWIAYSCDRDLGMALGRPPAIQDEWVTAAYPSDREDALITSAAILPGPPTPSKLTAIHIFRIRRLQSEIIHRLYASTVSVKPDISWFTTMQAAIDAWASDRPPGTGFCSDEWLSLCFHQTITLLHRPSPGNPSPTRESLDKALRGSSATMKLYKDVYRTGQMNFGWLSMYHLFISGVTYLNSLWQAYRNGWRLVHTYVDALLDMQVCTSVMEGLAALTPEARSIRNTWETVSEKMIRQLSQHMRWDPSHPPSRPVSPSLREPPNRNMGDHFAASALSGMPAAGHTRTTDSTDAVISDVNSSDQHSAQAAAHANNNPFNTFPLNNTVFTSHVPFANAANSTTTSANVSLFGGDNTNGQSNPVQDDPFDFSGMATGAGAGGLIDNPFDTFLLHPLGEMTTDDWNRAVASVFGPGQPGGDFSFN